MTRNEGNQVTGHMVGTMAPVVGQAMANPLGVVSAFVLLGLVCIVIAIVKALAESLGESFAVWGPMALLVAFLAAPYAGHRWLWGPLVSRKVARTVTLVALCVTLVVAEGFLGLVGLAFGRAIGFNPRAALMDAGLSTPDAVRAIITNERARVERADGCRNALAGGTMFEGKASSVNWAFNCRELVPIDAQRRACGALADHPANSVNIVNESFCGSIGVRVKERGGAFPG